MSSSAPPLPEVFGNYALGDFVEVVSPQAISWLPQTSGWWWLGAALAGALLHYLWKRLRHWYRNRYRREAARRLQLLANTTDDPELVLEINKLLKLTAMAAYSREDVASLWGEDWVNFLNRQCAAPAFSSQQSETLATGVYRADTLDTTAGHALVSASLDWVREHQSPGHD